MTYAQVQAQERQHDKSFAFKKEKRVRTLAEKVEEAPVEIWSVRTERGTSRDGFGLNKNPVSQKNRAAKKHRSKE